MTVMAYVGIVLAHALHKRGPIEGGGASFTGKNYKSYRRVTFLIS